MSAGPALLWEAGEYEITRLLGNAEFSDGPINNLISGINKLVSCINYQKGVMAVA